MYAKTLKTTHKQDSKATLGTLQKDNKGKIWECVLYLRGDRTQLIKLADRASTSEGFTWCLSKIRPTTSTTTMLSLQYKFRGQPSDFYRKYEEIRGEQVCRRDTTRPPKDSKSVRLVRAIIKSV